MVAKTREERLHDVHCDAITTFDEIQSIVRGERLQCLEDRRFYSIAGAQWEGDLASQFDNKPKFEVNKIHLSVMRIISEYRNNRISVDFKAKVGSKDDKFADACDGMYRADENDCTASEAYDNAFEEGVGGGFGAWRLRTKYEDDEDPDDETQRIIIEPIFDADVSVFFDLQAKRQDKADARKCFIISSMSRPAYEEEYGDDPTSWPKELAARSFDWCTPDVVYVAEYYAIEEKKETLHVWKKLDGSEIKLSDDELEDQLEELEATGAEEVRVKKIKKCKVHKYILSGGKVLEDCGYIAGSNIPIVPFYGKRWFIDNVERCMGHVRLAKDAQRLKNMQLSKLGEISALSTVEKPILTPDQVAGHVTMWEDDVVKNFPYLLINPITDANGQEAAMGPVGYTRVPQIPPAMAALLQITEGDMQDLLGNQQAGEEITGNVSTETAHLVQNRLDMQTFIYMSNFAKAMKRSGEIWLSMAGDTYVEDNREMGTLTEDGASSTITLMQPMLNDETSEVIYKNDFANAKLKVVTDVGPSSSTKRMATVRMLNSLMGSTTDPETMQVLSSMIMTNMEGDGISDVREYFRAKMVHMGVIKPTEEEARDMAEEQQNAKPSPQDQYFQAAAAKEATLAQKNQVELINIQAEADKTRAETQEILAGLDLNKLKAMIEVIDKLGPRLEPTTMGNQNGS
jgi:hypothetical protein